jgi:hypothetical protein
MIGQRGPFRKRFGRSGIAKPRPLRTYLTAALDCG